ncbi:MAG: tRNA glutamyl-Q(34) synthetase GluQRS [Verrucomicrobia bacterium]|nr:MAG: tRNA glutamyl-Q(34) synthetase GluQRS [Verrucomicrobiota bacterium]
MKASAQRQRYRGRIAPTPTGPLHLGHLATFRTAWLRAREAGGTLVYRNEDIDPHRCRRRFVEAAIEDLRWAGLDWDEGPDVGGPFVPYDQSARMPLYRAALERLRSANAVYPCTCSRRDVAAAAHAPHAVGGEVIYPGLCRHRDADTPVDAAHAWRFRVPDGEVVAFVDGRLGPQGYVAGRDFGDFIVWRRDDAPAYELAVVVDDAAMEITEVVRGEDLLLSTARQLLLYRALGLQPPAWYHCPLVRDERGRRLAKRDAALGLRELRAAGWSPAGLVEELERRIG